MNKEIRMKRRLKLVVIIDYEKMLKNSNVKSESEYHLSEKEIGVIDNLCDKIFQITDCKEISLCVEDLKHTEYDAFEKSSKMGSKIAMSRTYKPKLKA